MNLTNDFKNFKSKDYLIMVIIALVVTFISISGILLLGSTFSWLLFGRELDKDIRCALAFAWTIKEWMYPGMMRATIVVQVMKIYRRLL